jgi:hypothetical protein
MKGETMQPHLARRILFTVTLLASLTVVAAFSQPANAAPPHQDSLPTFNPNDGNISPNQDGDHKPQIVIESYSTSKDSIAPGDDFDMFFTLRNAGGDAATNISITFTPGDLVPRETGGVLYQSRIDSGGTHGMKQPLTVSTAIAGGGVSNLVATISYYDNAGEKQYTGTFNLSFHVNYPSYTYAPTKTATPMTVYRPQLTITGYSSDVDPLEPGKPFNLKLQVRNLGNADAKGVTMIMGGGSGSSGNTSGTPEPGGVSGGSGEFTNFAPLKSSNIKYIGDVPLDNEMTIDQALIVNTSTNPGAYSVKFSFVYVDQRGTHFTDDQVITLLVFQIPLIDITFYHEAGPFYPGQPGLLPIQITNLSRKPVVLGNMKASVASGGTLTNDVTLVGAMDAGNYFTLDANLIPDAPGPMDIEVAVNYTDDFNQLQTIHRKLHIDVQEAAAMPEGPGGQGSQGGVPGGKPGEITNPGGSDVPAAPETFSDKLLRVVKGLIGLDSGVPQPAPAAMPTEDPSMNGGSSAPIVVPGPAMKGG